MSQRSLGIRLTAIASAMLVMMAGGALLVSRIPDPVAPNLVLIVLDTVRYDRTSLAPGANPNTTPYLAELAAKGTSFARARSPAEWTLPAHASMLTGLLPRRHGAHFDHRYLAEEVTTLAESLARSKYVTAGFSSNVNVSRAFNFDQGFDHFYEAFSDAERLAYGTRSKALLANLGKWLHSNPTRPVFLFVNLMEAHLPYDADPAYLEVAGPASGGLDPAELGRGDFLDRVLTGERVLDDAFRAALTARYDAALRTVDDRLREVVTKLHDAKVLGPDSILIVTSDHGEHLGENGLVDHHGALSESLLRVPLVFVGRGIPAGLTVDAPIGTESIPFAFDALRIGGLKFEKFETQEPLVAERWPAHEIVARLAARSEPVAADFLGLGETAIVDSTASFKLTRRSDGVERLFRLEGVAGELLLEDGVEDGMRERLRAALEMRSRRNLPLPETFAQEAGVPESEEARAIAELAALGYGSASRPAAGGTLHAQIHLERGNRAFAAGAWATAHLEYEGAARLAPRFPAPYFNLAVVAEKSGATREEQRNAWERYVDIAVRGGGDEGEKLAQAYARLDALK